MSNTDGITDEVRKREEEYFRRKDRELIERMRQQTEAASARQAIESATGIHDPESLRDLEALGFTPRTITLLPLVPVLQVAWAEGSVTSAERELILNLARARGIEAGSDADAQLQEWLDRRPPNDVFAKAGRLIGAMLDHPEGAEMHVSAADLLKYCEQIAHASGGVFGFGSVSAEEKVALQEVASQLKRVG